MNVVEPIFAQCGNKPAELALCATGTDFNIVSYGRLIRSVNNVCQRIISLSLAPRSRVAVFVADPVFHAITLIALARLGMVTVSARTAKFSWRFAIDAVVTDQPFQFPTGRVIPANAAWMSGDGQPPGEMHIHRAAADDLCRIFLASGADGAEQAVAVTNRMMASRINRQTSFLGPRAPFCTRTHLGLPLTTSLGFQVLLATLWRGGTLFLGDDAEKAIGAFAAYKVQNMVGSPQSLLKFVEAFERRPQYRSALEAVFAEGSTLSDALSARIRTRLCTNLAKGYESTEATMVASMPAHFAPEVAGAAGYVLPGMTVEIVDDNDRPLSPQQEGSVRIRSPHGASEYLEDPEASQRGFRDGWFHPDKRGYLTNDKLLVITDRAV
jgi:acyl-CoA synthetase (AMP-forming)/AMP-acid ligase II